ncbi:MAG TPA: glycosyltransferase, partial [Candidatus Goldiibacteriota bacterium]|nr:glycosyltransferase [Candidatus Goldiibacteriota bacterium]
NLKGLRVNIWEEIKHPISPFADIAAVFRLAKYFKDNKIDVVNTHSSKAGILGRLAARLAGVKKVVHTVHGFSFHEYQNPAAHLFFVMIESFFAGVTSKFVAVGKDVADYGIKKGVGTRDKYIVIRPGIDVNAFKHGISQAKKQKFLSKYGLDRDKFTVVMIGNCKKQKNPMGFAAVACLALEKIPDMQFIFAGDGPLKAKAEKYVAERGFSGKVKFIGWTDEPDVLIKSSDLFLLTSLWEGIPCALAQAAAAGLPIIASDIAGNREFMSAIGAKKFLYPALDYSAAAALIGGIYTGKMKYKASPNEIVAEFDSEKMTRQYAVLFKE